MLFEQLFIQLLRQIDLIDNRDRAVSRCTGQHEHVLVPDRLGAVKHRKDKRGGGSLGKRTINARLLNGIGGIPQAGRIGHTQQQLPYLDVFLDQVARCARDIGHDRAFPAQQRVEQRGLARIRAAEDDAWHALAQDATTLIAFRHGIQAAGRTVQQGGGVLKQDGVDILVRKIHHRMEMRDHTDQLLAHLLHGRADRAHHLRRSILRGFGGACGDQVVHGLRFGKAELAVEERTAGKLARLRLAHALREQGVQRKGEHRGRPVALQLGHGFAGIGVRCVERDRIAAVDQLARFIAQRAEHQLLSGRIGHADAAFGLEDRGDRIDRMLARYPDQTDRTACGRDSGNRIIHSEQPPTINDVYGSCCPERLQHGGRARCRSNKW